MEYLELKQSSMKLYFHINQSNYRMQGHFGRPVLHVFHNHQLPNDESSREFELLFSLGELLFSNLSLVDIKVSTKA